VSPHKNLKNYLLPRSFIVNNHRLDKAVLGGELLSPFPQWVRADWLTPILLAKSARDSPPPWQFLAKK
jgi:hypothetical protein